MQKLNANKNYLKNKTKNLKLKKKEIKMPCFIEVL